MNTQELDRNVLIVFSITFLLIILAGLMLSVSTKAALITLFIAFINNAVGFGMAVVRDIMNN